MPKRQICIREPQLSMHLVGEVLAVTVAVPILTYIATRKEVPPLARIGAGTIAAFSLIIDGFLLTQWARRSPGWWGR